MQPKKPIGVYLFIAIILIFIPSYLHYQYSHLLKASKANLIYDHNKHYNRKMSFPIQNFYKIFNASTKGDIEQITFADIVLKNQKETLNISLLGDKAFFYQLRKRNFSQSITTYYLGKNEVKEYFLKLFKTSQATVEQQELLMYHTVFIPFLPSYLGHLTITEEENKEILTFNEISITLNIITDEQNLIRAINTKKYQATYSDYKEIQGVTVPHQITLNDKLYELKKIKMNIINTRH